LASPDDADALALTFAYEVMPSFSTKANSMTREYDPFART
jgi:hypothetical protein